ncbi:UNVERIFIED_CONTAM: putative cyclic nucleotide-gated ion channel 3 [Sesamum calycinum]|uniref:Cyclic nucleotide-gated ion channel 3 n=1 Tax=Sesamum calycinum TaxID=2727403 RepID=A0AAW2ISJ0_9LAMI
MYSTTILQWTAVEQIAPSIDNSWSRDTIRSCRSNEENFVCQVCGAAWYLIAVERKERCWQTACRDRNGCNVDNLYCGVGRGDTSFLNSSCPLLEPNEIKSPADFDFGIFLDALQSHVAEHTDFSRKFFYCFWWGWRNLSSLGQNLNTSTSLYFNCMTVRLQEMRIKRREIEQWMSHRMLPQNLRARIRRYERYKWQENRGVEEESLISNFPKDLRRDIKHHLCWTLLTRVGTLHNQFLLLSTYF